MIANIVIIAIRVAALGALASIIYRDLKELPKRKK